MFRLFGFEVRIHPSFLIMAVILGQPRAFALEELSRTLSWVAVVTVSVLVHELGHAFLARAFGGAASIELYSLGGRAFHTRKGELTQGQRALISFAGPLFGLVLGGLAFALRWAEVLPKGDLWRMVVGQLIWVNIGWGALNLLPLLPLDGGNILCAALDGLTGGKGTRPAQLVSLGVGVICVALALSAQWWWAGMIAGWCVVSTFRAMGEDADQRHDAPLWEDYAQITSARQEGQHDSEEQLKDMLSRARSSDLRAKLAEDLGWEYVRQGRGDEAARTLSTLPAPHKPPEPLLAAILYQQGRLEEAIPRLRQAIDASSGDTGTWSWGISALGEAYLQLGQPEKAVLLLQEHGPRLGDRSVLSHLEHQLFEAGQFTQAAQINTLAFSLFGHPNDAYNAACSLARAAGSRKEAIAWLHKAVEAGFADLELLNQDTDLDALRALPEFAAVQDKLAAMVGG